MELNDENKIFDLMKNQQFNIIEKMIKEKKITNFDIKDTNYNYFIQYLINYNRIDIMKLILSNPDNNIRLDIIDTDGRSILFNCIKFSNNEIIELLLQYNKTNIGISIIDIKDKLGFTALHYCIMFNNFIAFVKLLENGADPYIKSNDGNAFILSMIWKRDNFIEYLIDKKYKLNFLTKNGETILQMAIIWKKHNIIKKIFDEDLTTNRINMNNRTTEFGLTALHYSIIFNNINLFEKLLDIGVDVNLSDFQGMTALHYIFNEKQISFIDILMKKDKILSNINFNICNINGMIPLHILLSSDIDIDSINKKFLDMIFIESDLNIQDNDGKTCFILMIENKILSKFRDILVIKPLNFFIQDMNNTQYELTDEILNILVESYYNMIRTNKDNLSLDWEKWCANDIYDKLKTIIKNNFSSSMEICKAKIKDIIKKERRSLPHITKMKLN